MAKFERWGEGGQNLIGWQHATLEARIALVMSDAYMNLAAFQHWSLLVTKSFAQFHAHVGKAFSISRQEDRQDTFDRVGRGGNLQYPPSPRRSISARSPSVSIWA